MEWIKNQEKVLERRNKKSSQRMEARMQGIGNLLIQANSVLACV